MSLRSSLRPVVFQTEKLVQRIRFRSLPTPQNGWPVLLSISFPKSGTHLLDQILLGFSRVAPFSTRLHSFYAEYEGESGRRRAPQEALDWLDCLHGRDVASAHLFAQSGPVRRVIGPEFISYFIFRDPRDVAVSHVFYVTGMEARHVHHDYYASLPDFDSRLKVSILGRPEAEVEFPNIASRFEPYLGWLDHPEVMKIRFEDLVNHRAAALNGILDHFLARVPLGLPRNKILDSLEAAINPGKSPTFRSGRTGEWKERFTPEHKKTFKAVAGDLLIRLGYEKNTAW